MSVDTAPAPTVTRSSSLDRLRGLAITCMIIDHLCVVFDGPQTLRMTIGRVAMPLFFLLAGHLSRRLRWRHLGILGLGLVLPLVVPWIDNPNVLVWYVAGAAILAVCRWGDLSPWVFIGLAMAAAANGYPQWKIGTGYDGAMLMSLMCAGALLPRSTFDVGDRLPAFLAGLGRYPVTIYAGHLVVLTYVSTRVLA